MWILFLSFNFVMLFSCCVTYVFDDDSVFAIQCDYHVSVENVVGVFKYEIDLEFLMCF